MGKLGKLKFVKTRKTWMHQCSSRGCKRYLQPDDFHPIFFRGAGSSVTPLHVEVCIFYAALAGVSVNSAHLILNTDHKAAERVYSNLDAARARYVEHKEKSITYGSASGDLWRDVEADEVDVGKALEEDSDQKPKLRAATRRCNVRRERSAKTGVLKDRVLIFPPAFRLRQQDWSELAFRSKLCICPDGDSPNTGRLIEVIMHGCVPLIISNRLQPPFHQLFDWSKIAFFMREDALPHLPRILEQFKGPEGDRRIRQKRHRLGEMSHLLDYSRDGVASTLLLSLREQAFDLRDASS
eukprot:s4741_g10.t1